MAILKRLQERSPVYTIVTLFAIFAAFPFFWALITMFKRDPDLYNPANNPFLFAAGPTGENVELILSNELGVSDIFLGFPSILGLPRIGFSVEAPNYVGWLINTAFIGTIVVIITLIVAIPAAYSLARLAGRWGEQLGIGIFLCYLIPPTLLFIPLSRVVAELGLQDNKWSLVLVYPAMTIPFCTWLLMGFLKSIPRDIEEQALVDGYSRLGAVFRTVIPLALPGIVTVVVFAFAISTHEFIYALSFVSVSAEKTISVGVPTELIRGDVFRWQSLMAGAVIAAIPVALVYNFFIDRFVAGFTLGAVKG